MTQIFNRSELKQRRRELRRNMTGSERRLWSFLRRKQFDGQRFRRQYSVGVYVLDFYCPEVHLAIEIDGPSHKTSKAVLYDKNRQEEIEFLGIRFLRFTNEQVDREIATVLKAIRETIAILRSTHHPSPDQGEG